jgi:hypothetical protein
MTDYTAWFQESLSKFKNAEKWDDADFKDIKIVSNTNVGSVGQDFIERLCQEFNYDWDVPRDERGKRLKQSPWDIRIHGIELEIKTATEDVSGNFQFNHLRLHRTYDAVLCLGVAPNDLYFGIWSKADVATGKAGTLVSMEKNANASYKLTKAQKDLKPIADFDRSWKAFLRAWNRGLKKKTP